jgi:hypothetical protein
MEVRLQMDVREPLKEGSIVGSVIAKVAREDIFEFGGNGKWIGIFVQKEISIILPPLRSVVLRMAV